MVRVPNAAPTGPLSQSGGSEGQNTCACAHAAAASANAPRSRGAASTRGRADRYSSATAQHGTGQETPSRDGDIGSADHLGSYERGHAAKPWFACPSERDPRDSYRQTRYSRRRAPPRCEAHPRYPTPPRSPAPAMRLTSAARRTAPRPPREGAPGSLLEAPRRTQPRPARPPRTPGRRRHGLLPSPM